MSSDNQLYFILDDHEPVPCTDLVKFSEWMYSNDSKNRIVAKTVLGVQQDHNEDITVSTVFLGLDHAPSFNQERELFETMVFGGEKDGFMQRYATWDKAEEGHKQVVLILKGELLLT